MKPEDQKLTEEEMKTVVEKAKEHGIDVRFEGDLAILKHADGSEKRVPAYGFAVLMHAKINPASPRQGEEVAG